MALLLQVDNSLHGCYNSKGKEGYYEKIVGLRIIVSNFMLCFGCTIRLQQCECLYSYD